MKYLTISLFSQTRNVWVSAFDDEGNHIEMRMNAERFKRVLLHPEGPFKWTDCPGLVDIGPNFLNLARICSQEFADALAAHPAESERIFKRCFQNIMPEIAGAEIRDVEIKVYYPVAQQENA